MMCLVQISTINVKSLVKVKLVCVFILISDDELTNIVYVY